MQLLYVLDYYLCPILKYSFCNTRILRSLLVRQYCDRLEVVGNYFTFQRENYTYELVNEWSAMLNLYCER